MLTRKLGNSDLCLSTVGFGTATIGGGRAYGWSPMDDSDSVTTIHHALDMGINWLDTALFYGDGHAESISAQALAKWKNVTTTPIIVATKCLIDSKYIKQPSDTMIDNIRHQVEGSLKRLNREVIDLYQIHWPPKDNDWIIEEAWGAIVDLIRDGKIRYAGVSNFSLDQIKRVQSIHPVASLQPPYSMLNRDIEKEILPYCAANGIGVIGYSPMQSGLLTGRMTREYINSLPASDWRMKTNPGFREPRLSAILDFVEQLRPIADRNGRSVGQLAIAWTLLRPEVTAAIVGASSVAQIDEIAPAGNWILSAEDRAEIESLLSGEYSGLW